MEETLEEAFKKWSGRTQVGYDKIDVLNFGAKWQQEQMLAFINDEDNHTEGELGNSCIDVKTLVNFIEQFKK